jgi:5-formyltetrahydrofolate cyclo-ligase
MSQSDSKEQTKKSARLEARARRAVAHRQGNEAAGIALRDNYLGALDNHDASLRIVAGYWPMGDEIDVRPLLEALADKGAPLALPAIDEESLVFRAWNPGDVLAAGPLGTREPTGENLSDPPNTILVPLLAFDGDGYRLGYGKGYYDQALAKIPDRSKVRVVGVAYTAQEVEKLPRDNWDQPLDWIVTESGAKAFR